MSIDDLAAPPPAPSTIGEHRARDGALSAYRRFEPRTSATRASILILPAMGVAAAYYDRFAWQLAARGFVVTTIDLRGVGTSSVSPLARPGFGYVTMVENDVPVYVETARAAAPGLPLFSVGHSLGGHAAALHAAHEPRAFDALSFVACGTLHYAAWPKIARYRILASTQIAATLGRLVGHFPGHRVGFGGRQPASLMRDWARQCRTGRYELHGARIDYDAALKRVTAPALGVAVAGDDFAPPGSTQGLLDKLGSSRRELVVAEPDFRLTRPTDPHFRWAKDGSPRIVSALDSFFGSLGA